LPPPPETSCPKEMVAMIHKLSFDIQTPDDFFTKVVLKQYKKFVKDNASTRKALIVVIVAYHMFDWAYRESLRKQ
jgi:hypothetical protein